MYLFITKYNKEEHASYRYYKDIKVIKTPLYDANGYVFSLGLQFPSASEHMRENPFGSKKFLLSSAITEPHPGIRAWAIEDDTRDNADITMVLKELGCPGVTLEEAAELTQPRKILQIFNFGPVRLNKEDVVFASSEQNR